MFDTLKKTPERHTPNDEYENFVTVNIDAKAEYNPTKLRAKWKVQ